MKNLLTFGNNDLSTLMRVLFCIGNLPLAIISFLIGNHVYNNNTYMKVVEKSGNFSRAIEANNLPLGLFVGILVFLSGVIIWKIICELIYIIVNYYKSHSD